MTTLVSTPITSAQIVGADGTTPVPGKQNLTEGSDFSLDFSGAPQCELSLTMLSAATAIGPDEHLVITYRPQLDDDTQNGITLTNVAGATGWFSADPSDRNRQSYDRTVTNGTVGTSDHEDAHTVTVALTGFFFEKSIENLSTGTNPAAIAAPGETLRYTLRIRTTDTPLNDVSIYDDLGEMNAVQVFRMISSLLLKYS